MDIWSESVVMKWVQANFILWKQKNLDKTAINCKVAGEFELIEKITTYLYCSV